MAHVFADGEEIVTTPEHPFYVPTKGWTGAIHLRAGDILALLNGEYVTVEKVQHEILEAPVKVYNFEVDDFHTYYVGDAGVLVHNVCTKAQAKKIDKIKFETDNRLVPGTFHRKIKPMIFNKVKPNYKVGRNPDILLDAAKNIAYQGINGRGFQDIGLNMMDFLKEIN